MFLKFAHLNVQRGLLSKKSQIEFFLDEEQPHVFLISEHGQNNGSFLQNISLANYRLSSYFCREGELWGGTAIYIRNTLGSDFEISQTSFNSDNISHNFSVQSIFELSEVRLNINETHTPCAVIYRPPHNDHTSFRLFFDSLDKYLASVVKNTRQLIIAGDFNIDPVLHEREFIEFQDILSCYGLNILADFPTRISKNSESCLDYFISNINGNITMIEPFISDHSAILCGIPVADFRENLFSQAIGRNFCENNILEFKVRLGWEEWRDVYDTSSVNSKYDNFIETILHHLEIACPQQKLRFSQVKKMSWITSEIKIMKTELLNTYSRWISTKDSAIKREYSTQKNIYRKAISKAKSDFIKSTIKASKNPSKTSWQFINNSRNNVKSSHSKNIVLSVNNTQVSDPYLVSNTFNDFFSHIPIASGFHTDQHSPSDRFDLLDSPNSELTIFPSTNKKELLKVIQSMSNKKSSGKDGLSMEIIKKCSSELINPLLDVVNSSLRGGVFPDGAKLAIVKPLFKKDDPDLPQNYRPISLLPTISKIIEKIACNSLVDYLMNNEILFINQFGYQRKKSTKLALVNFVSRCIDALDGGETAIGCFIDLSKAFDCVVHSVLLEKLAAIGIKDKALEWIESYLSNRSQITKIDATDKCGVKKSFFSDSKPISYGVPQGSILGPILFLIYINDISNHLPSNLLTIFADDTSLLVKHKDLASLEQETFFNINTLSQYFSSINLHINPQKTQSIVFMTDQKRNNLARAGTDLPAVVLNEDSIAESEYVSYLGVRMDGGLRWTEHIAGLAKQLSSGIFVLKNISSLNNLSLSMLVYYSLFESLIRYSIILWGHSSSLNLNRIFRLQKRAVRTILKLKPTVSCLDHFKKLNILTVPSIYMFETIVYVKEQNLVRAHQHSYNTRNRNFNPSTQHNLRLFECKPEYIGLKLLTKIPNEIAQINDLNKFKKELKSHLLNQCFYQIPDLT